MMAEIYYDIVDVGKKGLVLELLDKSASSTEHAFWQKLSTMQRNEYRPSYKDEDYMYEEKESVKYEEKRSENGEHKNEGTDIQAHVQFDTNLSMEPADEKTVTVGTVSKKDKDDDEFWKKYEEKLYSRWLNIDNPRDQEYITNKTNQMTKAILTQLGIVPLRANAVQEKANTLVDTECKNTTEQRVFSNDDAFKKAAKKTSRWWKTLMYCFRRKSIENENKKD